MNTQFLTVLRCLLKSVHGVLLFLPAACLLTGASAARGAPKRGPDAAELAAGFRDDQILVRLRPEAGGVAAAVTRTEATTLVTKLGGSVTRDLAGVSGLHVITTGRGAARAVIAQLKVSGLYAYVEPDWIIRVNVQPNDPRLASGELWGLHNTGQNDGTSDADIDAPEAWDIRTGAPGVVVAVVDSGVRYTHEDIAANMWRNPGESGGGKETNHVDDDGNGLVDDVFGIDAVNGTGDPMDDNGHGTHCAGIIAGVGNNGLGVTGVAWQTRIMACKFSDDTGSGDTSDAIACINYARTKGAHILSNSWGGAPFSQALKDAISAARASGIIFVASAGNSSSDNDLITHYPSNYAVDNIVAVASTGRTDLLSPFSSYGAGFVELAAPGSNIVSLGILSDSDYTVKSGTSMAAPHVSGVLALLKAQFPADNYRHLINRLQRGTDRVAALSGKTQTGRVNAAAALSTTGNSPYNDSFSTAPLSTGSDVIVRGSNVAATVEAGEPVHAGVTSAGASLWWRWTATGDGTVNVSTAGSGIDTVLGVYSGAAVGSLTAVASNDNESAGILTSKLTFTAASGTTYSIAVSGKAASTGLVLLQLAAVPPNDRFASALALTGSPVRVSGSNRHATKEPGEPGHGGNPGGASVWWSWTAPDAREYSVKTSGSTFDTLLGIYTGSAVNSLTLRSQNDDFGGLTTSEAPFTSVAGTTYYFAVDGKAGATGGIALEITAPPLNDQFANRTAVPAAGGMFNGSNTGASRETGEPSHGGNSGGASVWWMWTPSVSGPVEINTIGSSYDTLLGVYTGSSAANLTTIADDDDSGDDRQSKVSFNATGGTPYHIAVDGYGGETGNIILNVVLVTSPPVITSSGAASGYIGSPFNYTIEAINSPTAYGTTGLPAGLSVDASTGIIAGTLSAGGTYNATISATNAFGTGSAPLVITVTEFSAPVAAAMDVPGQTFLGSGAVFWFAQSTTTHDGSDAARSGAITDSESSSMETTVTGPVLVSFWWKVSSEAEYDYLRAYLDGEEIDAITGEADWVQVTQALAAGPHTIRWTYSKDSSVDEGSDAGWVDQLATAPITLPPVITSAAAGTGRTNLLFSYRITATNGPSSFSASGLPAGLTVNTATGLISGIPAVEGSFNAGISATNHIGTGTAPLTITISDFNGAIGEALDAPGLLFAGSGDAQWFAQSVITRDGLDALQSGDIDSDEWSVIETDVVGPIDVSFWWKVSSELNYDYLTVEVDGILAGEISGEVDWTPKIVSIPAGGHTVSWIYSKDVIEDDGMDAGWIDHLSVAVAVTGSDSFAFRAELTGPLPLIQGSTSTAGYTREYGEPLHAGRGTASAWWAWTPEVSGIYTVSTSGSSFDTALAVYEVPAGAGVYGIVPMAMNDNNGGLNQSMVRIHALAGRACAIAVDGTTTGGVMLTITGPAVASGNDDFAAAAVIPPAIPTTVAGNNVAASRESSEPLHANNCGAGSLWWTWTPLQSGEAMISTAGSDFNTTLSVYTGDSRDSLVKRAQNNDYADTDQARAILTFTAGTVYHIAVDGLTGARGSVRLSISPSLEQTILPFGSTWFWLHPLDGVSPDAGDPDFNTTWMRFAGYNGPGFSGPSPGPLGFGGIDYLAESTGIGTPDGFPGTTTGNRTAYFKRQFTLAAAQTALAVELFADDGAHVYVDGVPKGSYNITGADTFTSLAASTGSEKRTATVVLGSLGAGSHDLGVSVHQVNATSADLGFDLRLYIQAPPPGPFFMLPGGAGTGFQEPLLTSTSYTRGTLGSAELGWVTTGGLVAEAGNRNPPLTGPVVGGTANVKALMINNSTVLLRTDPVYLDGFTSPVASADVRTFTTSTTNFELPDSLRIDLEVSTDGTSWSAGPGVLPQRTGGAPDSLIALNTASNSTYFKFSSAAGAVTSSIRYLRFVISGGNDSPSEYFVVDNLNITGVLPADSDGDGYRSDMEWWFGASDLSAGSTPQFTVSLQPAGLRVQFSSVAGNRYIIEKSANLTTWATVATVTATGPGTTFTEPVSAAAPTLYYRARKP